MPFNPAEVTSFSIGLSSPEGQRRAAAIWLDDLNLCQPALRLPPLPRRRLPCRLPPQKRQPVLNPPMSLLFPSLETYCCQTCPAPAPRL
jgi:hypothetical protein